MSFFRFFLPFAGPACTAAPAGNLACARFFLRAAIQRPSRISAAIHSTTAASSVTCLLMASTAPRREFRR